MVDNPEKLNEYLLDLNNIPPAKWILEGVVLEQGLTVHFAESESGKTTWWMQVMDAVKRGKDNIFGLSLKPVEIVLVEQDEAPRVFRNHRDRILHEMPGLADLKISRKQIVWNAAKKAPNGTLGDFENLEPLIEVTKAGLVVIDGFTSLGIPDINHPSTSNILDRLRWLNREHDVAFVLLHHVNRGGTILGSGTLRIKTDAMVWMDGNGLWQAKLRGDTPNFFANGHLPCKRSDKESITFKLSMSQRASILKSAGVSKDDTVARLMSEYNTTSGSARTTYVNAETSKAVVRPKFVTDKLASTPEKGGKKLEFGGLQGYH